MNKIIYMDNAATTKVDSVAIKLISNELNNFINPSALYPQASKVREAIEISRDIIANSFNIHSPQQNIFFTSCGSESDTWAIRGFNFPEGKNHIITSAFEHHAVLRACEQMEKDGYKVTYVKPHEDGLIYLDDIREVVTPETGLISIMAVNNVIGTIQPIKEIGHFCRENNIIFHTDAVQAISHIPIDVEDMCIDMMSCSGHKIHCPKGIGFLYVNTSRVDINNIIFGGGQNEGHRPGTENHPYILALAYCIDNYCNPDKMAEREEHVRVLSNYLKEKLLKEFTCININGTLKEDRRVAGNINVSFKDIIADSLVYVLGDEKNICISKGSACDNGGPIEEEAYVLSSMRTPQIFWDGMLRITLNEDNTLPEINTLIEALKEKIFDFRGYI